MFPCTDIVLDFLKTPQTSDEIAQSFTLCEVKGLVRCGRVANTYHVVRRGVDCCLKIIKPELLCDNNSVLQFKNEYTALVAISHQAFLEAFDWGEKDSVYYYFTEYNPHYNLLQYIEQGQLTVQEREQLFTLLVEACAYLHQEGMVHFGIKPGNILWDGKMCKLTQLGQVRFKHNGYEYPDIMVTEGFTDPYVILGKSKISEVSDVYSISAVGNILFENKEVSSNVHDVISQGLAREILDGMQARSTLQGNKQELEEKLPALPSKKRSYKLFSMMSMLVVLIIGVYFFMGGFRNTNNVARDLPSNSGNSEMSDDQSPILNLIYQEEEYRDFIISNGKKYSTPVSPAQVSLTDSQKLFWKYLEELCFEREWKNPSAKYMLNLAHGPQLYPLRQRRFLIEGKIWGNVKYAKLHALDYKRRFPEVAEQAELEGLNWNCSSLDVFITQFNEDYSKVVYEFARSKYNRYQVALDLAIYYDYLFCYLPKDREVQVIEAFKEYSKYDKGNVVDDPFYRTLGVEMAWGLIAKDEERVSESDIMLIYHYISCADPKKRNNLDSLRLIRWIITDPSLAKINVQSDTGGWDGSHHNMMMHMGAYEACIWYAHRKDMKYVSHPKEQALKHIFKKIYGVKSDEYKKYCDLKDAAYPNPKKRK